jgi:hypothetical protein
MARFDRHPITFIVSNKLETVPGDCNLDGAVGANDDDATPESAALRLEVPDERTTAVC